MREIKFRIWNKTTKIMSFTKPYFIGKTLGSLWFNTEPEVLDGEYELMQYTGLKDKNGKEIYENDIIKYSYYKGFSGIQREIISQVEFVKGRFGFYEYKTETDSYFNTENLEDSVIIGNTYENPELLNERS